MSSTVKTLSGWWTTTSSKRFKAAKRIRRFIKKVVLLTGTPSSKGLIDLWAQVYLLDGGARLGPTLSAYRERYFDPDQRSRTQIFSYKAKDGAESAVLGAISDICISMKAEDYLQLPDFIQHEIPVMLDPKAKKAYDQFERDLLLEVDEDIITAGTAGVLVGKLLQFCNGAVYGNDGKVVPVHDCKLEAYTELLEQLNGEHCLTFYGYQHDKDRILERLEKYNRGRADKLRVRVYKGVEDEEAWNAGEGDLTDIKITAPDLPWVNLAIAGLGEGTQSQSSAIPVKHSDFIFAVIGEELGLIGACLVLLLLMIIVVRCVQVGLRSGNTMSMLVCMGVAATVVFQTFENVGMCIGIAPVVGITLPFFSYGGSSLFSMFAAMGLVSGVKYRPKPLRSSLYGR